MAEFKYGTGGESSSIKREKSVRVEGKEVTVPVLPPVTVVSKFGDNGVLVFGADAAAVTEAVAQLGAGYVEATTVKYLTVGPVSKEVQRIMEIPSERQAAKEGVGKAVILHEIYESIPEPEPPPIEDALLTDEERSKRDADIAKAKEDDRLARRKAEDLVRAEHHAKTKDAGLGKT